MIRAACVSALLAMALNAGIVEGSLHFAQPWGASLLSLCCMCNGAMTFLAINVLMET